MFCNLFLLIVIEVNTSCDNPFSLKIEIMQIFKIIIGLILGMASVLTMFSMLFEERGAGLVGGFIGFILVGGLALWLIISGINGNQRNEK